MRPLRQALADGGDVGDGRYSHPHAAARATLDWSEYMTRRTFLAALAGMVTGRRFGDRQTLWDEIQAIEHAYLNSNGSLTPYP